ncbi:MAG: type VI secretion system contractile sheath small subunit [Legionellales bacterium]|nr:type VI secretion system contractile sheath small subunit [Legionellales bacterium]
MITGAQTIHSKPARINITLDLVKQGAKRRQELPLKLLILGDFSTGQNPLPIGQRQRLTVDQSSFDQAMSHHQPHAHFTVRNHLQDHCESLVVQLTFRKLTDFEPQAIIEQIPVLSQLMAMRHLLKDLKANLLDNQALRKQLNRICLDQQQTKQLRQELQQAAPLA